MKEIQKNHTFRVITFPAEGDTLNFLLTCELVLAFGLKWCSRVSLPVMILNGNSFAYCIK